MLEYFRDARSEAVRRRGRWAGLMVVGRAVWSAVRVGLKQRLGKGGADGLATSGRSARGLDGGEHSGRGRSSGWSQDIRLAWRSVRKRPGFSLIVIATMALGVGANTAVFGIAKATLFAPLPYEGADRLVRIHMVRRGEHAFLPPPVLLDVRERAETLDGVAAIFNYSAEGADILVGGTADRVRTLRVNADYFPVLGARPVAGRVFRLEEERSDARVAVVSERLLQRLGAFRGSVPPPLDLDGVAHEVVGVVPAGFEDPLEGAVDVWVPASLPVDPGQWSNNALSAIGRMRPGVSLQRVRTELDLLNAQHRTEHPDLGEETMLVLPLKEDLVGDARPMLLVLISAVTLLLLIACVNVASLFLARGAAREQELAIRSALGSSRTRLVRQLLVESVTFALLGGAAGLLLAALLARALLSAAPVAAVRSDTASFDPLVFLYGFGVAVGAGLLFGSAPALQFAKPRLAAILREGGRSGDGSRRATRARNVLVVGEFALALVLLIAAGILLRSFHRLRELDAGIRAENVLTFQVNLPGARYGDPAERTRFHEELHERIAALPGVLGVGAISRLPLTGSYHPWGIRVPGQGEEDGGFTSANQRIVAGDYFAAAGIRLLRGRVLGPEDRAGLGRRVVVNQALVDRLFPAEDAIGRRLSLFGEELEIVGVVGNVPITARGEVVPKVYHAHAQFADNRNWALVQLVALEREDPRILDGIRRTLADMDPQLVLHDARPLAVVVERGIARERFAMLLVGTFALLALALAAIGIYGVLAYAVGRRRREIGIRMALGARGTSVQALIVRHGLRLAGIGLAIGIAVALATTRLLESLVFGVGVRDAAVFIGASVALLAVALAASWIPAFAATRVDPLESFSRE